MPEVEANGVRLYYELHGDGEPLALVHGSWGDATGWAMVLPGLAENYRVLVYDRRGHSRSERPESQGSVHEDGEDLAALLEAVDMAPAHVLTNSYGGNVALRTAVAHPEVLRSLTCHEPPMWGLLENDPDSAEVLQAGARSIEEVGRQIAEGAFEAAARQFVNEVALGPGVWEDQLSPEVRAIFVQNAPTFLDELRDPDALRADEEGLAGLDLPLRFTDGTESPPTFPRVLDRLAALIPHASRETIDGVGHAPQLTAPDRYVEAVTAGVRRVAG